MLGMWWVLRVIRLMLVGVLFLLVSQGLLLVKQMYDCDIDTPRRPDMIQRFAGLLGRQIGVGSLRFPGHVILPHSFIFSNSQSPLLTCAFFLVSASP